MEIVDAQVHIWPPESPDRQWIETAHLFTHGAEFSTDALLVEMDKAGVDAAVLVPPSFEGDRNDYCLDAARAHPDRFAVMGRIDVTDPASRGIFTRWRDEPGMLGVRLTFSLFETRDWLTDGTADWIWGEAQEAGVPLYVWAPTDPRRRPPTLLPSVAAVAEQYPDLRLTLDHLALGVKLRDAEIDPVLDEVVALARFPNLAVKATCLPSYVTEPYPFPSLHDRIAKVVDAYGRERVFWGSDVSRLHSTYEEARRLFTDELDFLTSEDLEWIMGRGLRRWLGWPRT